MPSGGLQEDQNHFGLLGTRDINDAVRMIRAFVASALLGSTAALELTETRKYGLGASIPEFISNLGKELGCPDPSMSMTNFIDRCLIKAETAGKSVFIKFLAPW